jgi:hypothetical protein
MTIKTASELWQGFSEAAGLELKRSRGRRGRDADLEDAVLLDLAAHLGLKRMPRSVEALLRSDSSRSTPRVGTELLLATVLGKLSGFASMMEQILKTLELAKAGSSDKALGIEFRFDELDGHPLRYTLRQFGRQVTRVKRTLETNLVLPRAERLLALMKTVEKAAGREWVTVPDFPPIGAAPISGRPKLDTLLEELNRLVAVYRAWCRQFALTRRRVQEEVKKAFPNNNILDHAELWFRAGLATDDWDLRVPAALARIARQVARGDMSEAKAVALLSAAMAGFERQDRWVDRSVKVLLDMLDLPVWKKRHELYSVWAGTVLLRTAYAHGDGFRFHLVNGKLSFAFGGSQLATYERAGQAYEVWAELRSELLGSSKKRKGGIQPDFRVVRTDPSVSRGSATDFILECKHYLVQSRSNFAAAANDYANSCPSAHVFLVNHGPVDEASLTAECNKLAPGRIHFFGDASVDQELASNRLSKAIEARLFPPRVHLSPTPARSGAGLAPASITSTPLVATIKVGWDHTLQDVDLSLEMASPGQPEAARVYFRERGDLAAPPYALLHDDVKEGPGEECIVIAQWHYQEYVIVVQNFSEWEGVLDTGHVWCQVTIGGETISVDCPSCYGTEWRVGSITLAGTVPCFRQWGL